MVSEGFANFRPKEDQRENSCDVNSLETIWIIVDETTYKDPVPLNTGQAKTVTTLRLEECDFGHALELVHSIPHRLQNVRKHTGRHSGY